MTVALQMVSEMEQKGSLSHSMFGSSFCLFVCLFRGAAAYEGYDMRTEHEGNNTVRTTTTGKVIDTPAYYKQLC
jgi:hypothetical protein